MAPSAINVYSEWRLSHGLCTLFIVRLANYDVLTLFININTGLFIIITCKGAVLKTDASTNSRTFLLRSYLDVTFAAVEKL